MASKRRSYHPQEYLSQVLQHEQQQQQFSPNQCQRSRPNDFPKVFIEKHTLKKTALCKSEATISFAKCINTLFFFVQFFAKHFLFHRFCLKTPDVVLSFLLTHRLQFVTIPHFFTDKKLLPFIIPLKRKMLLPLL